MGREVKRVALDFDWPLDKVWEGFLTPDNLHEDGCTACGSTGYSPEANALHDRWYGKVPFDPSETGSTPFTPETPEVRAFAERHIANDSWFYGTGEAAIQKEALRYATLLNNRWCHHLEQADVDALVEAGRLMDFTHTWSKETRWQKIEPAPVITAEQVNRWSVLGFGHDSINCSVVIREHLKRQGKDDCCEVCKGHGTVEKYPGQRAEQEAWEPTEPPAGEGWQVWETVSEGSPISPVFADREGLIRWLMSPAYSWGTSRPLTRQQAENFTESAWAPTMVLSAETGLVNGDQYISKQED